MAADYQGLPGGKVNLTEQFKHILFSGFSGISAAISGFSTIARAEKIRVARKYITAVLSPQGMGQKGIHLSGKGIRL